MTKNKFFKIEMDMLENTEEYQELDPTSMMMYFLYRQRLHASVYLARTGDPRFIDNQGAFIFFTNEEMAKLIHTSKHTVTNARKKLAKLGLIKVKRYGLTKYKIYVYDYHHQVISADQSANKQAVKAPKIPENQRFAVSSKSERRNVQNVNISKITEKKNKSIYIKEMKETPNPARRQKKYIDPFSPTGYSIVEVEDESTTQEKPETQPVEPMTNEMSTTKPTRQPAPRLEQSTLSEVVHYYQHKIGYVTSYIKRTLDSLIKDSSFQMVNYAIYISASRQLINPIAYISKVIYDCLEKGITTYESMRQNYMATRRQLNATYKNLKNSRQAQSRKLKNMIDQSYNVPEIPIFKLHDDNYYASHRIN